MLISFSRLLEEMLKKTKRTARRIIKNVVEDPQSECPYSLKTSKI